MKQNNRTYRIKYLNIFEIQRMLMINYEFDRFLLLKTRVHSDVINVKLHMVVDDEPKRQKNYTVDIFFLFLNMSIDVTERSYVKNFRL
jgi:hypothetical protein